MKTTATHIVLLAAAAFTVGLTACDEAEQKISALGEESWEDQHLETSVDRFNDSVEAEVNKIKADMNRYGEKNEREEGELALQPQLTQDQRETISELEQRYDQLAQRYERLSESADDKAERKLEQVSSQLDQVEAKIARLDHTMSDAFDAAEHDADEVLDAIEEDLDDFEV